MTKETKQISTKQVDVVSPFPQDKHRNLMSQRRITWLMPIEPDSVFNSGGRVRVDQVSNC